MTMNKKEKSEMEELKILHALRWTGEVLPDVPIPSWAEGLVVGFLHNYYAMSVSPSCSCSVSHSKNSQTKTSSKKGVQQYSTRLLALKAMRFEVEKHMAKDLRSIDIMIEKELDA